MNGVFRTCVQVKVLVDLSLFGGILSCKRIFDPVLISALEKPLHEVIDNLRDDWYECIDEHRLHNGVATRRIPRRHEVVEGAREDSAQKRHSLLQVGVHQQDQQTRVEELRHEHAVGNVLKLGWVGAIPDPCNQFDGQDGKNLVEYNDENGNRLADSERNELVRFIDFANSLISINLGRGNRICLLLIAEASEIARISSFLIFSFETQVVVVVQNGETF